MKIIKLPGFIDPHVHLRTPGQEQKENFYTGTCAALTGGFTTIIDMPNNKLPITSFKRLNEKIKIAKKKIVCDVGFYLGSLGKNLNEFKKVNPPAGGKAFGLKLYLNQTTGNFLINEQALENIFKAWFNNNATQPILVHAEEKSLEQVIKVLKKLRKPVHICHISLASELKQIIKAKNEGLPITCGVTPHHLFLTELDVKNLGPFGQMKPPLKSKKDAEFLWKNLKYIDVIESDHAPHTIQEKGNEPIPFGVPGLETTLPLMLTAMSEKRLTIDDILRLCLKNPAKIFSISPSSINETRVEINQAKTYIIENKKLFTKCKWSPFNGWKVKGKVLRVFIRGKKVFEDGKILAKPGFGKILRP